MYRLQERRIVINSSSHTSHHKYEAWDTLIVLVVGVLLILLIEPTTFMQQFFEAALAVTVALVAAVNVVLYIQRNH
jgi:drug/metabolite transporter (DMT)-like permease